MPGSSILGPDARLSDLPPCETPVSAEFNWWLLIVGLIAGGALTWLVLADSTRREREIGEEELAAEAAWIARSLQLPAVDGEVARDVLRAHHRYLGFPPPDTLVDPDELALADAPVVVSTVGDSATAMMSIDPAAPDVEHPATARAADDERALRADPPAPGDVPPGPGAPPGPDATA